MIRNKLVLGFVFTWRFVFDLLIRSEKVRNREWKSGIALVLLPRSFGSCLKLVCFGCDTWRSELKDRYKGSCSKRTWNEFVYVSSWNERAWSERVIRLKELETEMETKGNEPSVGL